MPEKEDEHTIDVLKLAKQALISNDSLKLKDLSNQKIHAVCCLQDIESITITLLLYTLSKLIERKEDLKIKSWDEFVKKINSLFDLSISALEQNNHQKYRQYMLKTKIVISSFVNLKEYIKEVLQKASVNKASKLYEHGISLGQTAQLLGISQWEFLEYAGQTSIPNTYLNDTLNIKKRAQMALEFFS